MLKDIAVSEVVVGKRYRQDLGDISGLAKSIQKIGLLQPIGVTPTKELIFGFRRLTAAKEAGLKEVPARVLNLDHILDGEYAENEYRKELTISERVAIGEAVEKLSSVRRGERRDLGEPKANLPQVKRDAGAKAAGMKTGTYRNAKKVLKNGTPEIVEAVDSGKMSIGAAAQAADLDGSRQKVIADYFKNGHAKEGRQELRRATQERQPGDDSEHIKEERQKARSNGKPRFNDKPAEDLIGKLTRFLHDRAKVVGKSDQFDSCLNALRLLLESWKAWQKATT